MAIRRGQDHVALQFLRVGVRTGDRCLYVTLSETADELAAGASSHGWTLQGIEVLELTSEEQDLAGDDVLTMYHPSEVELTETTKKVLDGVDRLQPQRMVFDSLSELRLLRANLLALPAPDPRAEAASSAATAPCCCWMTALPKVPDEPLQSIAHGVISLEHNAPSYGPALRQLQVVKFRGSDFRSGLRTFRIHRGGLEVFPRLTAAEHGINFVREFVASGVERLDQPVRRRHRPGHGHVARRRTGHGQAPTVALQFAAAAASRGDRAAVFTFEEARELLLDRCAGLGIPDATSEAGLITVRRIDPDGSLPGDFSQLVRRAVEVDGARIVVIDSLNGYMNAMPEERALIRETRRAVELPEQPRCGDVSGCGARQPSESDDAQFRRRQLPGGRRGHVSHVRA